MKHFSLIAIFFLVFGNLCSGKEVPGTTAKTVGYHFLIQKGESSLREENDLKLIYAPGFSGRMAFYVYGTDHSFVIVSGEDATEPILGYATDHTFKADKMPVQVSAFLDGFSEQIFTMSSANIQASPAVTTKWSNLIQNKITVAAKTTAVTPLLSTTWDQSPYYNANCPYDFGGGGLSITGCVATAMAQVMKFWSWPANGTGIHSYSSSCCGTLSANFGSTTYSWASMPNSVSSPNPAVAKIMSHAGISVDMNYSASTSGAYVVSTASPITHCAEYAFRNYFNYKPTLNGVKRSAYSESAWIALLKADLDAGRPIVMAGFGSGGGHCFVADGYDASNFFHFNWGWSGSSNGYFNINALNPGSLGSGGGSGGYNSNQQAIVGLVPNTTAPSATLQLNSYVTMSAPSVFYTGAFSASTNIANTGTTAFSGTFCAAAFNSSGTFVSFIDSITGASLPAGFMTGTISFNTTGLLAMLPGAYTIGIFYRTTSGGWVAVANSGPYANFVPFSVVNHNPIELASVMTPTPATFVQGSPASVNLNLQNDDVFDFSGSYDVSLYNLDGTFSSSIETMTSMTLPAGYTYLAPFLTFSTTAITSPPGTYLLAVMYKPTTTWYLCGADYFTNPVYVTVVAPPPVPDIYEVNNTVAAAYNLPLTWSGDVATKNTTGSNIHVSSDNDYYKIVLASGYNYSITARVNDVVSKDDAATYTVDAVWSYSTDNGATWSSVFSDVMTGTIDLTSGAGGTVIFRVSPAFAGNTGNYLLKLTNISRTSTSSIPEVNLSEATVFPNPATDVVTVDLSGTGAHAINLTLTDARGRTVYTADVAGQQVITTDVKSFPAGNYILSVQTDGGLLTRKITTVRNN